MNNDIILKIAKLSKLSLTEQEVEKFRDQFQRFLTYVDQLSEVSTDDIEPYMTSITGNIRKDEVLEERILDKKAVLNLSANHNEDFFIVPTVVSSNK